jgi:hypothetical protein
MGQIKVLAPLTLRRGGINPLAASASAPLSTDGIGTLSSITTSPSRPAPTHTHLRHAHVVCAQTSRSGRSR